MSVYKYLEAQACLGVIPKKGKEISFKIKIKFVRVTDLLTVISHKLCDTDY